MAFAGSSKNSANSETPRRQEPVVIRKNLTAYFRHANPEESVKQNQLICKEKDCGARLTFFRNAGWGNFERHLERLHHVDKNAFKSGDVGSKITSYISSAIPDNSRRHFYERKNPKQVKFEKDVVRLVAVDGVPLNIGSGIGFRKLVYGLDQKLRIPSARKIGRMLGTNSRAFQKSRRLGLSKALNGSIHLTLDMWTSIMKKSVIGVRANYISHDWKLKTFTIGFKHFTEATTGANIRSVLNKLLGNEYSISPEKVGFVMADNASDMVKAFKITEPSIDMECNKDSESESESEADVTDPNDMRDLEDEDSDENPSECDDQVKLMANLEGVFKDLKEQEWINAKFKRLGCIAHALQLVVKESVKHNVKASQIFDYASKIVNFFRRSNYWTQKLILRIKKQLIRPGSTRWNSVFYAMKRLLEDDNILHLNAVLDEANNHKTSGRLKPPRVISDQMENDMRALFTLLRPLADLTNDLQGDGVTSSTVIPGIMSVYKVLFESPCTDYSEYMKAMKNSLCAALEERFGMEEQLEYSGRGARKQLLQVFKEEGFVLATILDPRLKLRPFKSVLPKNCTLNKFLLKESDALDMLKDRVLARGGSSSAENTDCTIVQESIASVNEPSLKKKEKGYDMYGMLELSCPSTRAAVQNSQNPGLEEIKLYLQELCVPEDHDPLEYWKKQEGTYPVLAELAKIYLGIPATSGSIERVFSIAGSIARARRARITIQKLESILFYRDGHRDEEEEFVKETN